MKPIHIILVVGALAAGGIYVWKNHLNTAPLPGPGGDLSGKRALDMPKGKVKPPAKKGDPAKPAEGAKPKPAEGAAPKPAEGAPPKPATPPAEGTKPATPPAEGAKPPEGDKPSSP